MGKMAYGNRKIVMYGIIGILAAIILSSSLGIIPNLWLANARTGTLEVKVTDAPAPDLKNLNLTISSFQVQNSTGSWITIPIIGGTKYFDLLKLSNVTDDLAVGKLQIGNFSKIRLKIDTANATLSDGRKIDLNVPSGHIDLQVKFEIKGGKTTSLVIDIIVDKVQIAERGSSEKPANLNPQFKFVVIPPTSST
jgi:hypothetical protein